MLHALRPAHLRDMHQALDARFEFNEGAIVGHTGDFLCHPSAEGKSLFNCLPGIREKLFVPERHSFAPTINSQYLDLNTIAYLEHLAGILKPSPGHVCDVQQSIQSTQIN